MANFIRDTKSNIKFYIKEHTGTATAFDSGDLLTNVEAQSSSISRDTQTFENFERKLQVTGDLTGQVTATLWVDTENALLDTVDGWFKNSTTVDILLVHGEAPAAAADNYIVYGTYLISQWDVTPEIAGIAKVQITAALYDSTSYETDFNATSFPSL